ncbi:DUF4258 domain-containing protein [Cyanobacterium aponinum]|uniref:DUF4258 domain-containing protein n=1 Tax=Cyanobacterium aponinum TaxID=379064 RepID=UPI000C12DC69|nr:DUF4258 domain-containing protein [Cyanobacterium aponinum]PHV61302.1 hypothetical protein CSQ80_16295 [Cyanobacterium aponinum IPPAS B-1201]
MLRDIRRKIINGEFELSKHAVDQSILRNIRIKEIREMINNGEIIEDYPDDKYGASCLICGFTMVNRPLHLHCSYPSRPILKIITLYQPTEERWQNNFTIRR